MSKFNKLEDSYEDIKGATLDTLQDNIDILKLPINQAVAYFIHEMNGIFEDNEFERIVTLIPIGIFSVENKYFDCSLINEVKRAIIIIESNKYNNLFYNENPKEILEDIKYIKQCI